MFKWKGLFFLVDNMVVPSYLNLCKMIKFYDFDLSCINTSNKPTYK